MDMQAHVEQLYDRLEQGVAVDPAELTTAFKWACQFIKSNNAKIEEMANQATSAIVEAQRIQFQYVFYVCARFTA